MKTKMLLFSLILSSLVFLSCQKDDVINNDDIINKSPVLSVSVSSITNYKVSFLAKACWGNSCGKFSHFTVGKIDTIFYITVYGKQPKNAICLAVVTEFDAPVDILVGQSGRFTFRFWQSNTATIDTTITF